MIKNKLTEEEAREILEYVVIENCTTEEASFWGINWQKTIISFKQAGLIKPSAFDELKNYFSEMRGIWKCERLAYQPKQTCVIDFDKIKQLISEAENNKEG